MPNEFRGRRKNKKISDKKIVDLPSLSRHAKILMKLSFVSLLASTWLTLDCLQDIIEWAIILITVTLYIEEIIRTFEKWWKNIWKGPWSVKARMITTILCLKVISTINLKSINSSKLGDHWVLSENPLLWVIPFCAFVKLNDTDETRSQCSKVKLLLWSWICAYAINVFNLKQLSKWNNF